MPNPELLTLSDVLRQINRTEIKDRSTLQRYTDKDEVAQLLGATGAGRTRKYPESHLWLFSDLLAAHEQGKVSPNKAEAYLISRIEAGPALNGEYTVEGADRLTEEPINRSTASANGSANTQLAPITGQMQRVAEVFADTVIDRVRASGIVPSPEDKLLTREEAAELLALSDRPHLVARRVPPVLPGTWSRLQIFEYMDHLRSAARAKAAARATAARKGRNHG